MLCLLSLFISTVMVIFSVSMLWMNRDCDTDPPNSNPNWKSSNMNMSTDSASEGECDGLSLENVDSDTHTMSISDVVIYV